MKASVKYIVLATIAVCFIFPGVIRAACNDANDNPVSLSVSGPVYVGIKQQKSYTLNAGKTPSSYSWNTPGFTVMSGASAKTVTVKANSSPGTKTIACTVSGSNWGPCTKGKGVTIVGVKEITCIKPPNILVDTLQAGVEDILIFPGDNITFTASPAPSSASFSQVSGCQFLWYEAANKGQFGADLSKKNVSWTAPNAGNVTCDVNVSYGPSPSNGDSAAAIEVSVVDIKATIFARDLLPFENNAVFDDHHDLGYVITHGDNETWDAGATIGHFADSFVDAIDGHVTWVLMGHDDAYGWVDGTVGHDVSGIPTGDPLYRSLRTRDDYEAGQLFLQSAPGPRLYHLELHNCTHYAMIMMSQLQL